MAKPDLGCRSLLKSALGILPAERIPHPQRQVILQGPTQARPARYVNADRSLAKMEQGLARAMRGSSRPPATSDPAQPGGNPWGLGMPQTKPPARSAGPAVRFHSPTRCRMRRGVRNKSAAGGSFGTAGIQGTVCQTPSSLEFGGSVLCHVEKRRGVSLRGK